MRALASLGQPTLTKWEEYRNTIDDDAPTLEQFYKFMTDRANVLEALNHNNSSTRNGSVTNNPKLIQIQQNRLLLLSLKDDKSIYLFIYLYTQYT